MTPAVKQLMSRMSAAGKPVSAKSTVSSGGSEPLIGIVEKLVRPGRAMLFGRQLSFAFDEHAIQVAISRRFGRHSTLIDVRKIYLPSTATVTSELRQAFVASTVEEILKEFNRRVSHVTITVSGPETAFRQVTLPALGKKELESSINFQSRKTLPFPTHDCWFDHRVTWRQTGTNVDRYRISLVGATRRCIDDCLKPFVQLGMHVQACHLAQDVIGQLLRELPDFSEDANYALINIERTRSEMSYFRGSNLEFSHILSVGSSFLANRTDDTMFEYFAESLASEIQNSLDYYAGQSIGLFGSRMYIYGDLSYSDDLIDMLGNRFEFDFRRFPVEELKFARRSAVKSETPIGVCLPAVAAAVNTALLPNLLPTPEKLHQKRVELGRRVIMGMAAILTAIALFWGHEYFALKADRAQLAELTSRVNDFKASDLYSNYQHIRLQIAASQNYLEQAKAQPSYFGAALKELTTLTPPGVRFQQFGLQPSESGRNFHIYGTVEADAIPPEVVLAEFVENLGASALFDDVGIVHYASRNVDGDSFLDFELEMRATI